MTVVNSNGVLFAAPLKFDLIKRQINFYKILFKQSYLKWLGFTKAYVNKKPQTKKVNSVPAGDHTDIHRVNLFSFFFVPLFLFFSKIFFKANDKVYSRGKP
jgi:hypothetical protein